MEHEPVLLMLMRDGSAVPLPRKVLDTQLQNGVLPRLLGCPMADGLTTPLPSRDSFGRYTVLRHLGMRHEDFLLLLQFLRTHDLTAMELPLARRAALLLGGVEALDRYRPPSLPYNPVCPEQDVQRRFVWTVILDSLVPSFLAAHAGYDVAGPASSQFYFYCRKLRPAAAAS